MTLGEGCGNAKVQWIETIGNATLYFLKAEDVTLFALQDGEARYAIGDEVSFDIDFTKLSCDALGIKPLNLTNTLDGSFTKEKNKKAKRYDFFINIGDAKLIPTDTICEKIFACKGNKIFHTPLEYVVDAKDLTVTKHAEGALNTLTGRVTETLDYGREKFAIIDVYGQKLIAAYDGGADECVDVCVPVEALTIKDKTIDIIIV